MPRRREFTRQQKEDIVARATDATGTVRCEKCGGALKRGAYEIDHIIPEGLRPAEDKKAKITLKEGQLLGKECCHRGEDGKTNKDVAAIAKAKRQAEGHNGTRRAPTKPLRSAGFPKTDKRPKPTTKPPMRPRNPFTREVIQP
jgi:hypothetical protein